MAAAGFAAALVLAVVFVRAGASKLARPAATAAGFHELGVPAPAFLARAVPVAELGLAVVLVAAPAPGAAASLGLLALFSAVLARALASGVKGGCNCFGGAGGRPVSGVDLARNAVLAALALATILLSG